MTTQLEMVKEAVNSNGERCKNKAIKDYILRKWPGTNQGSINDAINSASVNLHSRVNYPENQIIVESPREKYDFLFQIKRGMVELYDPVKHGNWGIFEFKRKFVVYKSDKQPQNYDYEPNYGILYHTDIKWLRFLKTANENIINFWSSRSTELKDLYYGMPFFFKTENQKIEGMASFVRMERISATEAWKEFERGNGAPDKETFLGMLTKDSKKDINMPGNQIMCFVLRDPVFFDNPPSLYSCGISAFDTLKYIDSIEASNIIGEIFGKIPDIKNIPRTIDAPYQLSSPSNNRPYEERLRSLLKKTYDYKCAICGLDIDKLLRVSHIIPHSENENTARNLDNSIFLCTLHDLLFDKGFITILYDQGNYSIKISDLIKNSTNPATKSISSDLSNSAFNKPKIWPPSKKSLEYHNKEVFIDSIK